MSGRKGVTGLVTVMMLGLILNSDWAKATTYIVGDSDGGWDLGVEGWEKGKRFKAGDTLVFSYFTSRHNVVVVDKRSFDSCSFPANARTYTSGHDQLKLVKGANYFICGTIGHCEDGMKIAAYAS